ncbi:MAG: glycosyltransferase [Candidatus Symbiothrix sp.]|jgi:rhamnosyltransferase|nr:glycosyltransferase [Candidatus Symbiothrix sp.]
MKITAIIPTLNAEKELATLLQALQHQSFPIDEIIVIDSQSDDATERICREYDVIFLSVNRASFNHGTTRDRAFRHSTGDFVLFFTQDALPVDEHCVEHLLLPFQDETVVMASGRQMAKKEASLTEKWIRAFNYPSQSKIRSKENIPELGIKTFFTSNVCAAYRRTAYLQVGGFESPVLTNEDMLIAARFIFAGYKVAYCAEAKVIHSHQFSLKQSFVRNYKIGKFMRCYASAFQNIRTSSEGMKMAQYVLSHLYKQRQIAQMACFCLECAVKWTAFQCGFRFSNPDIKKA